MRQLELGRRRRVKALHRHEDLVEQALLLRVLSLSRIYLRRDVLHGALPRRHDAVFAAEGAEAEVHKNPGVDHTPTQVL